MIFFELTEIAQVIASYTATGPEQLTLAPGQLILIRKKNPGGWWEGELQVSHCAFFLSPTLHLNSKQMKATTILK